MVYKQKYYEMRNIIVIAYQLHYSNGSECAVAWDYVRHMSRNNRLTVLYGSSAGHHDIGNTDDMDAYVNEHPMDNVNFIAVKPSTPSKNWDYSLWGIRNFYKEYRSWHEDVYRKCSELICESHYDLIHFLGPIGFHEPGRLYELPIPYIWGPIGGLGKVPTRILMTCDSKFGGGGGKKLIVKSMVANIRLHTNRRVKKALRESDVVVAATTEYARNIEKVIGQMHHSVVEYLPENCIDKVYALNESKFSSPIVNLIFIGWVETRKAPMILLEAMSLLGRGTENLHLDILGTGPMYDICQEFIREKGLEGKVKMHGKVERTHVLKMISNAHLMVLPSLSDANTTVVWEAMAHAVPTLCLDHCGMHDTIKDSSGMRVPVTTYAQVVLDVAKKLGEVSKTPSILRTMAENLVYDRMAYVWETRMKKFEELYDLAEAQYKKRKE